MQKVFNKNLWEEAIQYPDWYIRLEKELQYVFSLESEQTDYRHQVYNLFEEMLQNNKLALANEGPNFDAERQAIDTIVIHHTKEPSDISVDKLSGIGLLRQYALNYLKKNVLGHNVDGKPIWSGHFLNNKQVFCAYHWLIRPDGKPERLLKDSYIGWQAGNWDINTRSIGIALSGNYENIAPTHNQIKAIASLLSNYYPTIEKNRILGHREVNKKTTCPGNSFLSDWKNELYSLFN